MMAVPATVRHDHDAGSETNGYQERENGFFQDLHMFFVI